MNVHLYGAVSPPGCANFGLQRAAEDGEKEFGSPAAHFIKHNFYVDDGLTSVASTEKALNLITNTKALCAKKSIGLHSFASNDKEVLQSIPADERADCVRAGSRQHQQACIYPRDKGRYPRDKENYVPHGIYICYSRYIHTV
jgi:hypothetical protein